MVIYLKVCIRSIRVLFCWRSAPFSCFVIESKNRICMLTVCRLYKGCLLEICVSTRCIFIVRINLWSLNTATRNG